MWPLNGAKSKFSRQREMDISVPSNTVPAHLLREQIRHIPAVVYVTILVILLSTWHWKTTGHLSVSTVATFLAFSSAALIYGGVLIKLSPLPTEVAGALTVQFLFGFLLFNTALFVLSLAFPWSVANCFLTLVAVAVATVFVRFKRLKIRTETTDCVPDLLCLLIGGIGAMLWCADALSPIVVDGQNTVFKLWHDSFYHMRFIATFAQSHGLGTVSDIRMAGAPPYFYHYASYFTAAAFESLTGANAFEAFVGFQLPFGVLLTGLAAFALAASLWGSWPGLAASCAMFSFPMDTSRGSATGI